MGSPATCGHRRGEQQHSLERPPRAQVEQVGDVSRTRDDSPANQCGHQRVGRIRPVDQPGAQQTGGSQAEDLDHPGRQLASAGCSQVAAQALAGAVTDQIIEPAESCGTQPRDCGGCPGTAGQGSGNGAHRIGGALEQGHRTTRMVSSRPAPYAPGWAAPENGGCPQRAEGTDDEGT
jgi:hypothetical protein